MNMTRKKNATQQLKGKKILLADAVAVAAAVAADVVVFVLSHVIIIAHRTQARGNYFQIPYG